MIKSKKCNFFILILTLAAIVFFSIQFVYAKDGSMDGYKYGESFYGTRLVCDKPEQASEVYSDDDGVAAKKYALVLNEIGEPACGPITGHWTVKETVKKIYVIIYGKDIIKHVVKIGLLGREEKEYIFFTVFFEKNKKAKSI